MKVVCLFLALVALTGCSSEPIYLKKGDSIVQCGPYNNTGVANQQASVVRESQCINDYQRQGYQRTPKP